MQKKYRYDTLLIILLSILLLLFVCIKSSITSFTHDESYSYNHYVHQGWMDIVSYAEPFTNNHILNTLMMKSVELVFGSSELVLRLHSIIALLGYLFFCFWILKDLPAKIKSTCFILLVANPYLVDFFGLARGYGLSICFMTGSIYFIMKWLQTRAFKYLTAFNILASLACYSNFALINFYLSAFGIVNLILLLNVKYETVTTGKKWSYWLKSNAVNTFFMFLTALIIWEPIRKISKQHMLDFGGKSGIVPNTIASVVTSSFYNLHVPANLVLLLSWLVAFTVVLTLIGWVYYLVRFGETAWTKIRSLIFVNLTLMGIIVLVVTQHYILGNDYFIGRFALFLFPLFILNLIFCFKILFETKLWYIAIGLPTILAILFACNFFYNANFSSYLDWEYDKDTKQMMVTLEKQHENIEGNKKIKLGITWLYEPTVNFYRQTLKLSWLEPADREELIPQDDYFYSTEQKISRLKPKPWHILFLSKTGALLVRND